MINVLGLPYMFVRAERTDMEGCLGRMWSDRCKIEVGRDLVGDQLISTTLHEIIEAGNAMLQIGLDERAIRNLEVLMFQVLKENGVDLSPLLEKVDDEK